MLSEGHECWSDGAETFAGTMGALFLGLAVAGSIAHLVPGALSGHNFVEIGAVGVAFLTASYLVQRSRALLLGRALQGALIAVSFSILMVLPAIIKAPGDPLAWVLVVGLSAGGALILKVSERIRQAIEEEIQHAGSR